MDQIQPYMHNAALSLWSDLQIQCELAEGFGLTYTLNGFLPIALVLREIRSRLKHIHLSNLQVLGDGLGLPHLFV